jgi:hypothetical protein
MAKFTLSIDCGNDAFSDAPLTEVSRILTATAKQLADNGKPQHAALRDYSGNTCGEWTFTPDA